jgi:hypothetical protein
MAVEKNAIEINLLLREETSKKILATPSVGQKHRYKCDVKGQSKKTLNLFDSCLGH